MESEGRHRAFTLTELLVTIAVVAILIAVLVPAIGAARRAAFESTSLAHLRSIAQTMELYLGRYDDTFPYGLGGWVVPPSEGKPFALSLSVPTQLDAHWCILMHGTAPWAENIETWQSPGISSKVTADRLTAWTSEAHVSYRYSNSFVYDPAVWNGRDDGPRDTARAIRRNEVAHPSLKVCMFDGERLYLPQDTASDRRPVLMADWSAGIRLDSQATKPVINPLSMLAPRIFHDTPDGVKGRDFDGVP